MRYLQTDDRDDYFETIGKQILLRYASIDNPKVIILAHNKTEASKLLKEPDKTKIKSVKSNGELAEQ